MAKSPEIEQDYTDEEVAKRRDRGLRNLLKTPPKPHADVKGKGKGKRKRKRKPTLKRCKP
jgi:hypothetical protein